MHFLFVKPAPGREARHETPPHAPIAAKGELVPETPYYLRQRDLHGDTVDCLPDPADVMALIATPAATGKPKPTTKPKKEA